MKPTCETCRFLQGSSGQCRRRSPHVRADVTGLPDAGWPHVDARDWCGEFERRPECETTAAYGYASPTVLTKDQARESGWKV